MYLPKDLFESAFPKDEVLYTNCLVINVMLTTNDGLLAWDLSGMNDKPRRFIVYTDGELEERVEFCYPCTVGIQERKGMLPNISWFKNF